jgi:hypothetical protein
VKTVYRLGILICIALVAGVIIIFLSNYLIISQQITDLAAKATILAGVLTFLATIFTALYNEISSYYKDKSNTNTNITTNQVMHMLFLIAVFDGYRLRFIIGDGGLVILSSTSEEDKVNTAYQEILDSFRWADDETPKRVSELQNIFILKDKKNDPYVLDKFEKDVNNTKSLQDSRDKLADWLKIDANRLTLDSKLKNFVNTFKSGIDKVYSNWET